MIYCLSGNEYVVRSIWIWAMFLWLLSRTYTPHTCIWFIWNRFMCLVDLFVYYTCQDRFVTSYFDLLAEYTSPTLMTAKRTFGNPYRVLTKIYEIWALFDVCIAIVLILCKKLYCDIGIVLLLFFLCLTHLMFVAFSFMFS